MTPPAMSSVEQIRIDRAADRPVTRRPGFMSRERFDFGGHHRPDGEPFGALVVFNEDAVDDGTSIPMHPHVGVEVVSLMLDGEMEHVDDLGNRFTVGPDDMKVMHSGSGLFHGGTCHGDTRFLQIWIESDPEADRIPAVDVGTFDPTDRSGRWQAFAAPTAQPGTLTLRRTAWIDRGTFLAGTVVELPPHITPPAQHLHLVSGDAVLGSHVLSHGDAASIVGAAPSIRAVTDVDIVVITQQVHEVDR